MLAAAAAVLYPVCVSWLWRHQAMVLPLTATGNGGAHGRTWIVYNMCIVYRGGNTTDILCIGDNTYFILLFIYVYFVLPHPGPTMPVSVCPCLYMYPCQYPCPCLCTPVPMIAYEEERADRRATHPTKRAKEAPSSFVGRLAVRQNLQRCDSLYVCFSQVCTCFHMKSWWPHLKPLTKRGGGPALNPVNLFFQGRKPRTSVH